MDKRALAQKIKALKGLSNDEKSALLELLNKQKKYGLVWEKKPEDVELQLASKLPVLTEVKERAIISDDADAPNHILIEGDNLHALTALSYTHASKIDVIYIDPPYNTGNKDFIFNDSYVDKEDSYRHSKWLSFMSKRLEIAKSLLSDRGVIFISVDDNEVAQLKLLCDEIFGEWNCRNIINTRRLDKNISLQFIDKGIQSLAIGCEYVLLYSKAKEVNLLPIMREAREERKTEGYWKGFWNAADRPTMRYELFGFTPTSGQWKWKEEKAIEAVQHYNEYLKEREKNQLLTLEEYWTETGKQYKFIRHNILHQNGKNKGVEHWVEPTEGILRTSNWSDIITTETHLDFQINFNSPKSRELISTIIKFGSQNKSCILLDFFAGSGTTLHATMQLNDNDNGHRQCILVTNNENNICEEVTYERNRRVIQGYTKPNGEVVEGLHSNNLRYYKTAFVPREKTMSNKRALTAAATDLLCIKNNVYQEAGEFGGVKLHPKIARYFDDGKTKMLVIYAEAAISNFVQLLLDMKVEGKILVYVFAGDNYAYNNDFEEVLDKVELCALPDAIYKAYKKVLPSDKITEDTESSSENEADNADEEDEK